MKYAWLILLVIAVGCGKDILEKEPVDGGLLPLAPYVAIGGSETAGFADGALHLEAQLYSYPALIAQQLKLVGGSNFAQPLTTDSSGFVLINGILNSHLVLGYSTDCNGVQSLVPVRGAITAGTLNSYGATATAGPYGNWGLPLLRTADLQQQNLSASNYFYKRMGADSITISEAINNRSPKLFTVWLGMQDILDNAINQAPEVAPIQFYNHVAPLLDSLTQDTSAVGFMATLPDVTTFPFFNTIPYNALALDQPLADALNQLYAGSSMAFQAGPNAFVIEDAAAPGGKRQIKPTEKLMLTLPLDSVKCLYMGSLMPISARYVLDEQEIASIRYQIESYNLLVRNMAAEKGLGVVDINALYQRVAGGITVNGQEFNNVLVNGGFFSLDGINPSRRGAALIANEFIKVMNAQYRASIPLVSVLEQPGIKFP